LFFQAAGAPSLYAQEDVVDNVFIHVVNSVEDGGDAQAGDGVCNDGAGRCTLRAALEETNAGDTPGVILFEISGPGPHVIQPNSALPEITQHTVILGVTESDYLDTPVVELNGSKTGGLVDGLRVRADGVVVWGLAITGFEGSGIKLLGKWAAIGGNHIGLDASGNRIRGNGTGITVVGPENYIGGSALSARNVVSGNAGFGIRLAGPGAQGNLVQGNFIGTDVTGARDFGNGLEGVWLFDGAGKNMIGGTADVTLGGPCTGACNLISGNGGAGIGILGSSSNVVQGNFIGTDVAGAARLPNMGAGVGIWCHPADGGPCVGGADNTIGGAFPGAGNLIYGNDLQGVVIIGNGDSSGSSAARNVVLGNVIRANGGSGVTISDAVANVIGGAEGTTPYGACTGACNVISYNGGHGVHIHGFYARGNVVKGNHIGADAAGRVADGNAGDGVLLEGAPFNTVGGSTPGSRNTISGNLGVGVRTTGEDAHANTVSGNNIGTDVTGTAVLPNNGGPGVWAGGAPGKRAH
jgi:titin